MKRENIINNLKEIFNEKEMEKETEILKDEKGYVDSAVCLAIIPKTKQFKEIMNNFDVEENEKDTMTKLDYHLTGFDEAKEEIRCLYSMEYLTKIFNLCKDYDKVKIKMKRDFPLWVETEDFICVLAPRVESED